MSTFNKQACEAAIDTIKALRAEMQKHAFIPMPGDQPPAGGAGMPPGAGGAPPGPQGPPPGMDPNAGGPPPDPSGGQAAGAGGPPPGAGGPPPDPSGGQGGPPPGSPQPDPSQQQQGPGDQYSQAIESVLEGLQQLAESQQQLGAEFDKRIAAIEQMGSKLELAQKKNEQDLEQLAQAHEETGQSIADIMPMIQSMQQPSPMDGGMMGGGSPEGGQEMPMDSQEMPAQPGQGMPQDPTQAGPVQPQGDPMAGMGMAPQGLSNVQG